MSNRMSNIGTVCEKCHIPKNHKEDGLLWGLGPRRGFRGAAFMNTVKWYIYEQIKSSGVETHITYGAVTSRTRKGLGLEKSHANDAYCIGAFRPEHRAETVYYEKRRRNNRVLEKFYDAKYIDKRDGKVKKGSELGCNRPNRKVPRNNEENCRPYRQNKVSKGRRVFQTSKSEMPPGTKIIYKRKLYISGGIKNNGAYVVLKGELNDKGKPKYVSTKKAKILVHSLGWIKTRKEKAGPKAKS